MPRQILHSRCHAKKILVVCENAVSVMAVAWAWNSDCGRHAWRIREFPRILHESVFATGRDARAPGSALES
jgi:hypothetical protein